MSDNPSLTDDPQPAEFAPVPEDDESPAEAPALEPAAVVELAEPIAPPVPAPAPANDEVIEAVRVTGEWLGQKLDGLQTLFDREIRAEATREKVVDRLHAELQEYKQDLLLNTLRPVFIDLIQLHDDMGKFAPAGTDASADPVDTRMVSLLRSFQQAIEDILYRQGVEPYEQEGDQFDPRRQRAVRTVSTDDPALNKTVAARHRKGFQAGDRVIRPEVVSVYAFKA